MKKIQKEKEILREYIGQHNLKLTRQRRTILEAFLETERHVSAEELYKDIRKRHPEIGLATVYRTLNLLSDCGLAQPRQFGDGETRYEHIYDHSHHDHLVCTGCGRIIEFESPAIEDLQDNIAKEKKFKVYSHRLELYGLCSRCSK